MTATHPDTATRADAQPSAGFRCPICNGVKFVDFRSRKGIQCQRCGSLQRHRAMWLFLRDHVKPQADWRVLHLAPEVHVARFFMGTCDAGYEPADINANHYAKKLGRSVRRLDLINDAATLPSDHYDLVVHSHVMEHVPSNVTLLLQHLHRAIKPGGVHLFALPIWNGYSREDFNMSIPADERRRQFGHPEHVRRFGREDFDETIGAIFGLTNAYSLADHFSEETLTQANILPPESWRCSGVSVFMVRK